MEDTRLQPIAKIPAKARIVSAFHTLNFSVLEPSKDVFDLVGVRDRNIATVEDKKRGIALHSIIKLHGNKVYIPIPKAFHMFYERGEEVGIVITILPTVKNVTRPKVVKATGETA